MAENFDAIVIGAGVIGSATALALVRKGRRVICLDRNPAAGYGSTSGSCAIIRPYYSTVAGSALAYESHFYWRNWADFLETEDERGLIRYVDCGCLVFKTEGNCYLKSIMEIMDEIGCPYEDLDAEGVESRLPALSLESYGPVKRPEDPLFGQSNGRRMAGAVFFPTGGYVTDPQLSAHNLQRAAEAKGAQFRFNAEVAEILKAGGRTQGVALANGSRIFAPVVVNVGGPHSAKINAMAGVEDDMKITTRALRHEVAHVPAPDGLDFMTEGCVISDNDTGAYMRPEQGNHVLVGSEDPECDEKEWVDPDDFNRDFTDQAQILAMRAAQRLQGLKIPNRMRGVVELYDVTEDWIPIYDKSSLGGFYMAVGTSGNQFKNAPIAGEMMADLIEACESGQDHDRDPVHFRLKNIDQDINIGFFSRIREINEDSSFSVLG